MLGDIVLNRLDARCGVHRRYVIFKYQQALKCSPRFDQVSQFWDIYDLADMQTDILLA